MRTQEGATLAPWPGPPQGQEKDLYHAIKRKTPFDDRTREDWRLRLALVKESAAYRTF